MPTNANVFNSRVTSEALEKKFRDVFPAQGGAELVQDLFASGVIQPVVDFSSVAEGDLLPEYLQTAWDFSVSTVTANNNTQTIANTAGFWQIWGTSTLEVETPPDVETKLNITDGISTKVIWRHLEESNQTNSLTVFIPRSVVFLRSGDTLSCTSSAGGTAICVSTRQIADVNGNPTNPLGFSFS